ncbi:MAG TPA: PspC domain-containing protein [Acidimicrobiales bacterium]|nr:PspC domain-containing protein [Acidimicrobiales bacterium]
MTSDASAHDPTAAGRPPRLTRSDHGIIAGVCAGVARSLGVDPVVVRVAVVVLTLAGGTGAAAYVAAWLLLPRDGRDQSLVQAVIRNRRWDLAQVVAAGSVCLGALLIVRNTGFWFDDAVVWPLLLAGMGLALIWRQAGDDERQSLVRVAQGAVGRLPRSGAPIDLRSRRAALGRVVVGVIMVVAGVGTFLAASDAFSAVRQALVASTVIIAGLALISGPWWLRLGRDLARERRERIRSEERAEVAAHLHDSVLQTLALIQRNAADPRTVVTMARRQERELRGWLWETGRQAPGGESLATEVSRVAAEIEASHAVSVDVVAVGDCPIDDRLRAMVAAAREAMVNAATWSGVDTVSVYTEVKEAEAAVFVRDWGSGFDPAAVAPDRHGVSESISGRMTRNGGAALVRSTLGEGTEVQLRMSVGQW